MTVKTFHIHIRGIVQGVGFRPFVYRSAINHNLKGTVKNTADGVHIKINSDRKDAEAFLDYILNNLPPLAEITSHNITEIKTSEIFTQFKITESSGAEKINLPVTPDVAMCNECKNELNDPENRRFQYPFITCTNCGPRYSIITQLPYDRPHTTMAKFKMCKICEDEYNNPLERRHFSQTNSCPDCKIEMQLYENAKQTDDFTDLQYIAKKWKEGKIIAVKGIGGFLLTCDASNPEAIAKLRKRKNRPAKPFALMYPDTKTVKKDVFLSETEKKELLDIHAPIVLLKIKDKPGNKLCFNLINKDLSRSGIMLPYTPLFEILLKKFKNPVIATSGNISNSTIIYDNTDTVNKLSGIADIILLNNRDITIPQDDGVVKFTEKNKQKITLRRSRGKAPVYINPEIKIPDKSVFAAGSMMKSTFALFSQKNIYVSQYLGNTENYETCINYETTYNRLKEILKFKPEIIIADKHPDYFSSRFAEKEASENNAEILYLQHHKAHFYSLLGEHSLTESDEKILGVIWDGTGLGDDGNIWGGEFFIYENKKMKRTASTGEFDFILGNKMVKEPRISALATAGKLKKAEKLLKPKFTTQEYAVYKKLLFENKLKSTSVGRLFDAAASLILNIDKHLFEAHASVMLEEQAAEYYGSHKITLDEAYIKDNEIPENFSTYIIEKIIEDIKQNTDKKYTAAKFHLTLVKYVINIAKKTNTGKIAFGGGVFQNALLVDMIIDFMQKDYTLFFNEEFSPNDENIPFGQLIYAGLTLMQ